VRSRRVRSLFAVGAAALVAIAAFLAIRPHMEALSFIVRAADLQGVARRLAELEADAVREREMALPSATRLRRARVYEPASGYRRTALVVPGLHSGGIDEPRVVHLARALAASGVAVVTPEFPELDRFAIASDFPDTIEAIALDLASSPGLAPDGRVGLIGISFGGGPTVVAAGSPALRDRIAYVFVLGGYADLPRVMDHLSRDPRVHDYGVALVLLSVAGRMVPPDQVAGLSAGIRRFLHASSLTREDPARAEREFEASREYAGTLPEPSATLLALVNARDVAQLGPRLAPHLAAFTHAAALSPSRSPLPTAPVFLLHGVDDPVIPASESVRLAELLRPHAPVRLLLTPVLTHADSARPPRLDEALPLVAFWADLLAR
jgi:fermentation-respiration switch protein FrsA (DUF1100 family)